jgi:hypothetical protein
MHRPKTIHLDGVYLSSFGELPIAGAAEGDNRSLSNARQRHPCFSRNVLIFSRENWVPMAPLCVPKTQSTLKNEQFCGEFPE